MSKYTTLLLDADETLLDFPAAEKAARLAYNLISNHAFVDGNKRIGVLAMLMTLRLNGVAPVYTQQELIRLGLSAADGALTYEGILSWIQAHTVQ